VNQPNSRRRLLKRLRSLINEELEPSLLFSCLLAFYSEVNGFGLKPGLTEILELSQDAIPLQLLALFDAYNLKFKTSLFGSSSSAKISRKQLQRSLELAREFSIQDLAFSFEKFVNRDTANKEGVFYTPQQVVRRLVRESLALVRPRFETPYSVLDPACGSGLFLIESFKQLASHSAYSEKCKILSQSIYGVDKDPRAVSLTRLLLLYALLETEDPLLFSPDCLPDLSNNIVVGNSLIDKTDLDWTQDKESIKLQSFAWQEAFPAVNARGGFDCVLGNPPYGLSRNEQLDPLENEALKRIFDKFRSGKINKYLAFMARGYQLLRKGGELSFVVPNSWLGIESGSALRRFLLGEGALHSLVVYDCPVFDEPSVEAVTFAATREGLHKFISIERRASLEDSHGRSTTVKVPISECLKTPSASISINWSPSGAEIIDLMQANSCALGAEDSNFVPMIALQAYARGKGFPAQTELASKQKIFHSDSKLGPEYLPYLEGSDISRYDLSWSGAFLRYGPWLAEPQSLERFEGPRIIIREIINAAPYLLNATYVDEIYLYNKSVLHILPQRRATQEDLLALLAILNSKLASYYLLQKGRKTQRTIFPKIVNKDLKDFPIPNSFLAHRAQLALLARKALDANSPAAKEAEIDQAVFACYQLKNSHVKLIESELTEN